MKIDKHEIKQIIKVIGLMTLCFFMFGLAFIVTTPYLFLCCANEPWYDIYLYTPFFTIGIVTYFGFKLAGKKGIKK